MGQLHISTTAWIGCLDAYARKDWLQRPANASLQLSKFAYLGNNIGSGVVKPEKGKAVSVIDSNSWDKEGDVVRLQVTTTGS